MLEIGAGIKTWLDKGDHAARPAEQAGRAEITSRTVVYLVAELVLSFEEEIVQDV